MITWDNTRLTRAETVVLIVVLLATFRVCMLPAMLSATCMESCVYAVLCGLAVDAAVTGAALWVSLRGGLGQLPIHPILRRVVAVVLGAVCLFKLLLRTYEVVDYCAGELFEQVSAYLLALVLLVTAAVLASKGSAGIARTGQIFLLVAVFLAVLSLFFLEINGYGYNLWSLLHPQGVGRGLLDSVLWLGDGVVLAFVDTRDSMLRTKRTLPIWLAMVGVVVGISAFFVNFVYTYGSAGRYVQYAFIRLMTNGDPESLGAVDWPVSLIWLMAVPLHLAACYWGGCQGFSLAIRPHRSRCVLPAVVLVVAAVAYRLLFDDRDGFGRLTASAPLAWVQVGVLGALTLGFVCMAIRTKGGQKHEQCQ